MKLGNNSHLTAIERKGPSFPLKTLIKRNVLQGQILDYGCGYGVDADYLVSKGYHCDKFDPFYFPEVPQKKYDTIICFYVLNVLDKEEQSQVLLRISQLLKPSGHAFFAVRRDIIRDGQRMHKIHKKLTYQCNVTLPYESIFSNDFCEIYNYQTIVSKSHSDNDCLFCQPNQSMELICESAFSYAIYDKYPVNEGHALIIPKHHVENYFDLSHKEKMSCWFMVDEVKRIVSERFNVNDFNIGVNIGLLAGQTINHVHIHIIPRYKNDVKNPIGGIRCVIPEKQNYLKS